MFRLHRKESLQNLKLNRVETNCQRMNLFWISAEVYEETATDGFGASKCESLIRPYPDCSDKSKRKLPCEADMLHASIR